MGLIRKDCVNCIHRFIEIKNSPSDSLKEMAYIFGIDISNLDRLYRNGTGLTIKKRIDELRVSQFRELIKRKDLYGFEVAEILGFRSSSSFYQWVNRVYGTSFRELSKRKRGASSQKVR
jgi:methylphosphotriester-DNA--protein-cysteine methyltransferase